MGRYLLFAFNNCFPRGGWNDYILSDNDIKKIIAFIEMDYEGDVRIYRINNVFYDQIQLIDKILGNVINIEFKKEKKKNEVL